MQHHWGPQSSTVNLHHVWSRGSLYNPHQWLKLNLIYLEMPPWSHLKRARVVSDLPWIIHLPTLAQTERTIIPVMSFFFQLPTMIGRFRQIGTDNVPNEPLMCTPNPQPDSSVSERPASTDYEEIPQTITQFCQAPVQEFVIERIIAHRTNEDGHERYKVRWYDFPPEEDTWEPLRIYLHRWWCPTIFDINALYRIRFGSGAKVCTVVLLLPRIGDRPSRS